MTFKWHFCFVDITDRNCFNLSIFIIMYSMADYIVKKVNNVTIWTTMMANSKNVHIWGNRVEIVFRNSCLINFDGIKLHFCNFYPFRLQPERSQWKEITVTTTTDRTDYTPWQRHGNGCQGWRSPWWRPVVSWCTPVPAWHGRTGQSLCCSFVIASREYRSHLLLVILFDWNETFKNMRLLCKEDEAPEMNKTRTHSSRMHTAHFSGHH